MYSTINRTGMLTRSQINQYRQNGILIIRRLYSAQEIETIAELEMEVHKRAITAAEKEIRIGNVSDGQKFAIELPGADADHSSVVTALRDVDGSVSVSHVSWIGGIRPELVSLGRLPKLTVPVAQLLRSKTADHLINEMHYKMPQDGVRFPWHQDMENRLLADPNWKDLNGNGSFVQTIVVVDESLAGNGELIVVPRSHTEFLHLNLAFTIEEKGAIVRRHYDLEKDALALSLQPGDVLFMHPLVVHQEPNASAKSTTVFINGFSYPGANQGLYPGRGSAESIGLNVPENVHLA